MLVRAPGREDASVTGFSTLVDFLFERKGILFLTFVLVFISLLPPHKSTESQTLRTQKLVEA
jgi:hypothetical protein